MHKTPTCNWIVAAVLMMLGSSGTWTLASDAVEKQITRPDMTLFTTWFTDPTTSMAIQWLLYTPAGGNSPEATVQWQAHGQQNWQTTPATHDPFPLSQLTRYRVNLTDLKPDTLYHFKPTGCQVTYAFRTAPAKMPDQLVFATGGDSGSWPAAVQVNEQAAKVDPLFALIGGDIAYGNGTNVDSWIQFLHNWRKQMHRSDNTLIPLLVCIGNHEVDGYYNQPREKARFFMSLFDGFFRDANYNTMIFADYLQLIMLDSNHTTPILGTQTDWLKATLQKRTAKLCYVVYHVPAHPSRRKYTLYQCRITRENWGPLFEQYNVPVVFENHDHLYKRTYPLIGEKAMTDGSGVIYLGDGAWGAGLNQLRQDIQPEIYAKTQRVNHFIHVTLTSDQQHYRMISNTGEVFDELTLTNR